MQILYAILPHLARLRVADRVVAGMTIPPVYYPQAAGYRAAYVSLLLFLSVATFRWWEFL
jgi:hypothetical protein